MLWDVCLHRLCAHASLKISCFCGSPSPHLTVSPMGSRGCAWLPHLKSPFILAACKVFIIPEWSWKLTQSQVVVCDSDLLFWKVWKLQHSGVHLLSGKVLLLTQNAKLPLWPEQRHGGWFCCLHSLQPLAPALLRNHCTEPDSWLIPRAHHDTRLDVKFLTVAEECSLLSGPDLWRVWPRQFGKNNTSWALTVCPWHWFMHMISFTLHKILKWLPLYYSHCTGEKGKHREEICLKSLRFLGVDWD